MHGSLVLSTLPVVLRWKSRLLAEMPRSAIRAMLGDTRLSPGTAGVRSRRLLLRAWLRRALRGHGISGDEADVSLGRSAHCLLTSRYETWGTLLQCCAPVHNTWETCHSQGDLHHGRCKPWDLQSKQGKKNPNGRHIISKVMGAYSRKRIHKVHCLHARG